MLGVGFIYCNGLVGIFWGRRGGGRYFTRAKAVSAVKDRNIRVLSKEAIASS